MKILSSKYICLVMSLCIVVSIFSCDYQKKSKNIVAERALKKLEKDTLLNIVNQLAIIMQKKPHSLSGGKTLLQSYAQIYKINIVGAVNYKADSSEYLHVFVPEDSQQKPEMITFRFYPPQSLRSQITVKDLKEGFGNYTASPPMEEDTLSASLFNPKAAPNVFIAVTSKKKLGEKDNSVELITVMR